MLIFPTVQGSENKRELVEPECVEDLVQREDGQDDCEVGPGGEEGKRNWEG